MKKTQTFDVPLEEPIIRKIANKAIKFYGTSQEARDANLTLVWKSDTEATVSFELNKKRYDVAVRIWPGQVEMTTDIQPGPEEVLMGLAVSRIRTEINTWVKTWQSQGA